MSETAFFRGQGGAIHEMSLPLPETAAEQLLKGYLTRCNPDGTPYVEESEPERVAPGKTASKAAWVGWAVHNGADPDEAESLTRTDLIELYGG